MNIAFVCNEYPPAPHGGVGVYVKSMAEGMVRSGHKVWVIGAYPDFYTEAKSEVNGVNLLYFPGGMKGRISHFLQLAKFARGIRQLVRREKIDIVEAPEGGGWSMFFDLPCPIIIRLHNPVPYFQRISGRRRGRLISLAENIAIRRADGITAVSKFIAREAPGLYPYGRWQEKRIEIIYNGINTRLFPVVPYKERIKGRIVFAGTIKPMKGLSTLVRAFAIVANSLRECTLYLYGKDTSVNGVSYVKTLLSTVDNKENIRGKIHYCGVISPEEMPGAYASASVCVFPSFAESFGLVAAEAMSCGRPTIYTKATSGPELIDQGIDGFLCDPLDYHQLSEQIHAVLKDPENSALIGLNAAAKVRKLFDLDQCIVSNLEFYKKCIATK